MILVEAPKVRVVILEMDSKSYQQTRILLAERANIGKGTKSNRRTRPEP